MQLVLHPALVERRRIGVQLVLRAAGRHSLERCLGSHHAGLHRRVAALDARRVEEAGIVADQAAAGKRQLRQGLQPAGVDGARAVGDPLAAFQESPHLRMVLVALEFLVGAEPGVPVVQPDDEADRDQVLVEMVEEGAAIGLPVERPAGGMHDQARLVARRLDFPELLDTDAVGRRIGRVAQPEPGVELLAERAAAAFREEGVFRQQLHARRVVCRLLAVGADAHVAGRDAAHPAFVVVEHLGGGEAGIDFHAQRLGLLGQPAAQVAQADDVVAVIAEAGRQEQVRHLEPAPFGEKKEPVFADRRIERRAALLPVGQQFVERARIENRTGQDMRADFRAFFEDADLNLRALLLGKLLQANRGGQAGRAGADDHDIVFHRFAGRLLFRHPVRSRPVPAFRRLPRRRPKGL